MTGKSYDVPADMTYQEWYDEYIKDNPEAVLAEKKWKNRHADQKQYEKYKEVLGKDLGANSLENFQNLKYNNSKKWSILKGEYSKENRFNALVEKSAELHIKGNVIKDINRIDITDYSFAEVHINTDRVHSVTKAMAQEFITNSEVAYSRWNGKVTVYVSKDGCSVVNHEDKKVSTAYKSIEYDDKFKKLITVNITIISKPSIITVGGILLRRETIGQL